MKKLPTLFFLSSLNIGGSERKTVRVVNALRRRGLDVHLAYLNGPETLRPDIDPAVPVFNLERCGKFSWSAVGRLRDYVQTHGIARIICVNLYPLLYVSTLWLAMRKHSPSFVVTVNTTDFPNAKEAAAMVLYAPLMRRADRVVFGCQYQLARWVEKYRLPKRTCGHIYNGVDAGFYSPAALHLQPLALRESFGFGGDDFLLGTVGQLRPEKHQQDLIEAVHRLREKGMKAGALIGGGGPTKDLLRKMAEDLKVDAHIRFLGELRDVRPLLVAVDVFVLPSVAVETFSNAALEAMAMGKAVVLSDIAGAREMVWEGVNGHVFPKGDVGQLALILGKLSEDKVMRQRMGKEARRIAVEKFSFTRMVDEYETLFPLG